MQPGFTFTVETRLAGGGGWGVGGVTKNETFQATRNLRAVQLDPFILRVKQLAQSHVLSGESRTRGTWLPALVLFITPDFILVDRAVKHEATEPRAQKAPWQI